MPRHINRPKTIAERGGLKGYFAETAGIHNGHVYEDFLARIVQNNRRTHKIPASVFAEDFNVSVRTWYNWITEYTREQIPPISPLQA